MENYCHLYSALIFLAFRNFLIFFSGLARMLVLIDFISLTRISSVPVLIFCSDLLNWGDEL